MANLVGSRAHQSHERRHWQGHCSPVCPARLQGAAPLLAVYAGFLPKLMTGASPCAFNPEPLVLRSWMC